MKNSMRENSLSALGPDGFHSLHYYEWGDPENPRIAMCVHGLTRNGRDFDDLAQALSDHYRVICPDVVGRGKSAWLPNKADYGYEQYCADMVTLIARSGAQSVDWIGTSMGGLIGMMMASHTGTPIQRMVINDVGPFIPKAALERIKEYVGADFAFNSLDQVEMHFRIVSAGFGPLTDEQWRHLATTSVRENADGTLRLSYDPSISHAFSNQLSDVDLWHIWDKISCPTLLIRGGISDLLLSETAEEMTRRGPGTTVVEFDGIGHAPMLMSDDQISAVRGFLIDAD